ncbi:MAG TPA: hypothetical protein VMH39_15665 [Gemmatimonadaceae bacterium]|nr:hypothetical protein [Gemmatimonadaceae bacterium]
MRPPEPDVPLEFARALTAEQKLDVAQALWRTAWELTAAGVRSREPHLSDDRVEARVREIFSRAAA